MEDGSANPVHESSASGSHEAGWLSKPIVRDLLEHEQAVAIQTVFMPHLSSIENEVSSQSIQAEAHWKVPVLAAIESIAEPHSCVTICHHNGQRPVPLHHEWQL